MAQVGDVFEMEPMGDLTFEVIYQAVRDAFRTDDPLSYLDEFCMKWNPNQPLRAHESAEAALLFHIEGILVSIACGFTAREDFARLIYKALPPIMGSVSVTYSGPDGTRVVTYP